MAIIVEYDNAPDAEYNDLTSAEQGILETCLGDDYLDTVQTVTDTITGKTYACEWSIKLIEE